MYYIVQYLPVTFLLPCQRCAHQILLLLLLLHHTLLLRNDKESRRQGGKMPLRLRYRKRFRIGQIACPVAISRYCGRPESAGLPGLSGLAGAWKGGALQM